MTCIETQNCLFTGQNDKKTSIRWSLFLMATSVKEYLHSSFIIKDIKAGNSQRDEGIYS